MLQALLLAAVLCAAPADGRDISNGSLIYAHGYCDQPYIVVLPSETWLCVFTTSGEREGSKSQYIMATRSRDLGQTWSDPVPIEDPQGPEASWAMPLLTRFGRVYVFYTFNGDEIRTLPDGKGMRADTHGWYCYRFSDDEGQTWSERCRLPMRVTACDRGNDFGGKVQMFWGIGKPITLNNTAYFAFSKLSRYFLIDSEGWFYRSPNVLDEPQLDKVVWELLPEGDHGLRHPDFGSVQEEQNLVPLDNGALYCVYRTTQGHIAESYSHDGARTWSEPRWMRYADGRLIKHPRACPRIWRAANGRYLLWFHNHGGKDFADRNPAWIAGGIDHGGTILWSQPEILFYGPDHSDQTGRFSYPDLVEQDGRYWISLTQKTQATIHEVDAALLEGLWAQFDDTAPALPDPPPLSKPILLTDPLSGFSIELDTTFDTLQPGQILCDSCNEAGQGIVMSTTGENAVRIQISDGEYQSSWDSDPGLIQPGTRHRIVATVDGGPDIFTFVIDGALCDGGETRQYGWGRFSPEMGDVSGTGAPRTNDGFAGTIHRFRFHPRPLTTSQAVQATRQ